VAVEAGEARKARQHRQRRQQPAGNEVDNPEFVADLKALAEADLVMDTANPSVPLLEGVVRVSDKVPTCAFVIDHLPQMWPTAAERPAYDACMKAIKDRPQVYTKVSEVLRKKEDGTIPTDLAFYKTRIDEIVDVSEWTACSTGATGRTATSGCPSRSDSRSSTSISWPRDRRRPRNTSGGIRSGLQVGQTERQPAAGVT